MTLNQATTGVAKMLRISYPIQKWISVLLLCFVNLVNYMDRFTVSGVLTSIQQEMGLDNQQGGLIQTSFTIFYFASAPLFGFLGDRHSRKWLMIFGVFAWGLCTILSSFMQPFWAFLLCRAAIGFGEAGFTSIAPTVLGDLFNDSSRTLVLALFYFAIPVGSGLGYIIGSGLANLTGSWRWGLRFTPILSVAAIILMIIFLLDPPRGHQVAADPDDTKKKQKPKFRLRAQLKSWLEDLGYLITNRSYVLSTLAFTCLSFCVGALSWWGPAYIEYTIKLRQELQLPSADTTDPSLENVALYFGLIMTVAGLAGLTLGSGSSFLLRKRFAWIDPIICGVGLVLAAPFLFVALGTTASIGVNVAFVLIFFGQVFLNMNWAIVVDISMYVVVPHRRSSAEAFQLLASHALGEAGSPYLTGLIIDMVGSSLKNETSHWKQDEAMSSNELSYHSFMVALLSSMALELMSAAFFFWTTVYVISDKSKAEALEAATKAARSGDQESTGKEEATSTMTTETLEQS